MMSITGSTWIRGIIGTGIAIGIVVGATVLYPMSSTNLAGHILAWIMGGIVAIKMTLSAYDDNESWMEMPLEMESGEGLAGKSSVAEAASTEAFTMPHPARMQWKQTDQPILGFPPKADRGLSFALESSFHQPAEEEKKECIQFAAENPICSLATVDEKERDRPHVRTVFLWRADDSGFYFVLFASKNVSQQVKAHPDVELCFQNNPSNISEAKQLRIHGNMDLLENRELKEKASRDRNILNTLAGDGNDANIEIYRLSSYEMKFWQMSNMAQQLSAQAAMS